MSAVTSVPVFGATANQSAGQRYCNQMAPKVSFGIRPYKNLLKRVCMTPYVGTGWGIDFVNSKNSRNRRLNKLKVNQQEVNK